MNQDGNREKVKQDICNYLKEGMYKKDSAMMAGIDESTFYRWTNEDASFASRVEASILEYKHGLITNLTASATKNGTLAFKILETRWPREWKHPHTDDDADVHKKIGDLLLKLNKDIYDRSTNNPAELDLS